MKRTLKKKGFLVDKITEDSFYENLLLGLSTFLKACPFVSHINLDHFAPATLEEVNHWEFNNCLRLPADLRNFYLSTDGFSFNYKFQYEKLEGEESNSVAVAIEINPLSKLDKLVITDTMFVTESGAKILAPYSKIHLLTSLEEKSCVVLAQFNPSLPPNIWLYYNLKNFYFLCEDFVTYFRMALAHLGVPGWQLSVLKANLPEWSAEIVQILAPGIFDNRQIFDTRNELNVLDCNIFRHDNVRDVSLCESQVEGVGSVSRQRKLIRNSKSRKQ